MGQPSHSEQELSFPHSPFVTSNLDFSNYWVDMTLEREVLRGRELREKKPRSCSTERDFDVIYIEYQKPPRIRKNKDQGLSRSNYCRSSTHKCSMRIAELAVPSKRQCIDTWRYKNNVLPGFMVERLRQHVMDEKPVVKVSDAMHCFKRKHLPSTKRKPKPNELCPTKQKKINPRNLRKKAEHAEIRELCALFAYKIAQKLIKPLNIVLNTKLCRLSEVIAHDMLILMEKQKKIPTKYYNDKTIQVEMAGKVAIWIDSIIEESSYKLMEEDLKDLEEEEGPVLDFLDEVVENVLGFCLPFPAEENINCLLSPESITDYNVIGEHSNKSISSQNSAYIADTTISNLPLTKIDGIDDDLQATKSNKEESLIDENVSTESVTKESLYNKNDLENSIHNDNILEEIAVTKIIPEYTTSLSSHESITKHNINAEQSEKSISSHDSADMIETGLSNVPMKNIDGSDNDSQATKSIIEESLIDENLSEESLTKEPLDNKNDFEESADYILKEIAINKIVPDYTNNPSSQESITKHNVNGEQSEKSIFSDDPADMNDAGFSDIPIPNINVSDKDSQANKSRSVIEEPLIDENISAKSVTKESPDNKSELEGSLDSGNILEESAINKIIPEEVFFNENISKMEEEQSVLSISNEIVGKIKANINEIETNLVESDSNEDAIEEIVKTKNEEDTVSDFIRGELIGIISNINTELLIMGTQEIDDTSRDKEDESNDVFMLEDEHANLELKRSESNIWPLGKEVNQRVADDVIQTEDSLVMTEQTGFGVDDGEDDNALSESQNNLPRSEQEEGNNVSEVFNISNEELNDERNKRVKFSEQNMVTEEDNLDNLSQSIKNLHNEIIQNERNYFISKSSSEFLKPNIELRPANTSILSDVDELWPKEIPSPVLKPSASVSKSITSLGKILESDTSDTYIDIKESVNKDSVKSEIVDEQDNIKSGDRLDMVHDNASENKLNIVNKTEVETIEMVHSRVKEKSSYELEFNIDEELKSLIDDFLQKDSIVRNTDVISTKSQNLEETIIMETDLGGDEKALKVSKDQVPISNTIFAQETDLKTEMKKCGDKQKSTTVNVEQLISKELIKIIDVPSKNKVKCPDQIIKSKRDYKVNPLTAPAWVMRGQGEPSEGSSANLSRTEELRKLNEIKIRKWHKYLNQEFTNLQMWSDWIVHTCNVILDMQKQKANTKSYLKTWTTLKKNIEADGRLWTKFNNHTREKFKRFRPVYRKSSRISTEYYLCHKKGRANKILWTRKLKYIE